MSVCPGCGRCRQCGQPAPTPLPYPWWTHPYVQPYQQPIYPTITTPNTTPNYYVGDVLPGMPGYIGVTC